MDDLKMCNAMIAAGYIKNVKITDTLQGSVWRSIHKSTNNSVVIKVTDRNLHKNHIAIAYAQTIKVHENIKKEISILKQISKDAKCPNSITKYIDSFKSDLYYFLVMEDGGFCLFEFVMKAHRFIAKGILDFSEWHKLVKVIMKQMIECMEYIHSKNVCHFDISLENFLINDVPIYFSADKKMRFCAAEVQIKLCDFGLAEVFRKFSTFKSDKYCGKLNYQSPEICSKQKKFSAKSNDIWCLGVCFFMFIVGSAPWKMAARSDVRFVKIMRGDIVRLLSSWNRERYINDDIEDIFIRFFVFEDKRVTLNELKRCEWLQLCK